MAATSLVLYAVIRAIRPVAVNATKYQPGEVFARVSFSGVAAFEHFRRNLRWSAFEVVQVEEKELKAAALAGAAKDIDQRLGAADAAQLQIVELLAELKQSRKDLDAARKRAKDHLAIVAELTPAHLPWLDETTAGQLIAGARQRLDARTPSKTTDPVAESRENSLAALLAIDGIGLVTAARLHDHYHVIDGHRLEAVLKVPEDCARLLEDPELSLTAKDLSHWKRQLGIEE